MHSTVRFMLASAVLMFSGVALSADLPNPSLTPGAINSNVTQANIHETICVKGYTKSIRPPAYFTNGLKRRQIREYGYMDRNPRDYEEDHLVALSIGGHPTDERNLWPQPRDSEWNADRKDELEFVFYKMVCAGELALKDAQGEMAGDWISAWKRYVPSHPFYRYKKVD